MSPIQIALLLLAVAGVWAVIELALTLRKTRTVVDSLDKTVSDLNNTIAEAQPVVAKLDGAVDELTPRWLRLSRSSSRARPPSTPLPPIS